LFTGFGNGICFSENKIHMKDGRYKGKNLGIQKLDVEITAILDMRRGERKLYFLIDRQLIKYAITNIPEGGVFFAVCSYIDIYYY
jgi:hypothetical protein